MVPQVASVIVIMNGLRPTKAFAKCSLLYHPGHDLSQLSRPQQIGRNQPQAAREEGKKPPLDFFTRNGDRVGFSEAFRTSGITGNVPGFGQTVNWNQ